MQLGVPPRAPLDGRLGRLGGGARGGATLRSRRFERRPARAPARQRRPALHVLVRRLLARVARPAAHAAELELVGPKLRPERPAADEVLLRHDVARAVDARVTRALVRLVPARVLVHHPWHASPRRHAVRALQPRTRRRREVTRPLRLLPHRALLERRPLRAQQLYALRQRRARRAAPLLEPLARGQVQRLVARDAAAQPRENRLRRHRVALVALEPAVLRRRSRRQLARAVAGAVHHACRPARVALALAGAEPRRRLRRGRHPLANVLEQRLRRVGRERGARARAPAPRRLPRCRRLRRAELDPVERALQPGEVGEQDEEGVEVLRHADQVKGVPHRLDGGAVVARERPHRRPAVAGERHRHAALAVVRAVPKAQRHALVDKVAVPREVLQQRVAQQRHQVAAAAGGAQL
mmetsp:Transcript_40075/g.129715  ORF Transcript_40075/g.129715 Transcript_40075/m.129715 type:complete len:411 (+) Transcript_40075:339-1571(+)